MEDMKEQEEAVTCLIMYVLWESDNPEVVVQQLICRELNVF